jgi:glycine cleavage system transcriptional repressor
MPRYILTITARDRSGIVAGVSEVLYHNNGNIEAASQTVHQGYFTMILLCELTGDGSPENLIDTIQQTVGSDLHVYVTEYIPPEPTPDRTMHTFFVTSIGPDKPGILHALTTQLASRAINIDDLYCCVKEGDFVVICQVSVPAEMDIFMLQTDLEAVGRTRGFQVTVQHENIFVATNELRLARAW